MVLEKNMVNLCLKYSCEQEVPKTLVLEMIYKLQCITWNKSNTRICLSHVNFPGLSFLVIFSSLLVLPTL